MVIKNYNLILTLKQNMLFLQRLINIIVKRNYLIDYFYYFVIIKLKFEK